MATASSCWTVNGGSYREFLLRVDTVKEGAFAKYDKDMPAEWFADTEPKALEIFIRLHREMTPGQRLLRLFELCDFQEGLQIAGVRRMYPQADEREVFLRVAARRLGRELMIKAYDWDPDLHP